MSAATVATVATVEKEEEELEEGNTEADTTNTIVVEDNKEEA